MTDQAHWYAIINPVAGNGRSYQRWNALKARLDAKSIQYTEAISAYAGHVSELAGTAVSTGYTHFISVGGDG
jgi:diacylglycerol kinase family enzyme